MFSSATSLCPPRPLLSFVQRVNECLEDLVSRIDAPRLFQLWTKLFNDIHYDTLELNQFIHPNIQGI